MNYINRNTCQRHKERASEGCYNVQRHSQKQKQQSHIIITKCLSDPCPIFYTDTMSQSILIECKDPRHKK
jgi:hypothetical protein